MRQTITVETTVHQPIGLVWESWTVPQHIMRWNSASDDWYTPTAANDLRPGGSFVYRMAARDGSAGFDFGGSYDSVITGRRIAYTLGDGRKVSVDFSESDSGVVITETFEAEEVYPLDMQKSGWQAILDHFRRYTESLPGGETK